MQLGQLIVQLACGTKSAIHNLPKSIDFMSRQFSPDLKSLVMYLLSKSGPGLKSIDDVLGMLGPRMLQELNNTHQLSFCFWRGCFCDASYLIISATCFFLHIVIMTFWRAN